MSREEFIEKTGIVGIEILWLDILIIEAKAEGAKEVYEKVDSILKRTKDEG